MKNFSLKPLQQLFIFRWNPGKDLIVVLISCVLVVGALSTATFVIGQKAWGGMGYFFAYAVLGATIFGIGIPVYWMRIVRKRPLAELGITLKHWKISLVIQVVLALAINLPRLLQLGVPDFKLVFPLVWMALAIGLFEAIFWRGWVQLRLEESFGILPGIILAAALYSVYHIGYGMAVSELLFLFFIGLMFAIVFRITKSVLILWPFFQPGGQLITLVSDKLTLPFLAFMGFLDALVLMFLLIWWLNKRANKKQASIQAPQ